MSGFIQRNWMLILTSGIFLAMCFSYVLASSALDSGRTDRENEAVQLERTLMELEASVSGVENDARDTVAGINTSRINRDIPVIRDLMSTAMTWNSYESYQSARESVIEDLGIPEDSQFVENFIPEVDVTVDGAGNEYSHIDSLGLNSAMGDLRVQPLSVSGTEYRYMVFAQMQVESIAGGHNVSSPVVALVTTDADSRIVAAEGYISVGAAEPEDEG